MKDTLRAMQTAAHKGKKSLRVRRLAELITAGIAQGDYASEVLALYYWVCRNIRYIRDIDGVEFIKEPDQVIATGAGDCDDMATLLAALLMAAGNPVRFAIAGFKPGRPNFSHVYVEVMTPHGPVTIDPVANRDTPKMLKTMTFKSIIPVSRGAGTVDAGVGSTHVGSQRHVGPGGGNLFSVYDYPRGVYDYYEASTGALPATGSYRKPLSGGVTQNGITPEAIAAPLPGAAKKIGTGIAPKGIIAAKGVGGFSGGNGAPVGPVVVFAFGVLAGFYVYSKLDSWSL
jgi:hypothetical protein